MRIFLSLIAIFMAVTQTALAIDPWPGLPADASRIDITQSDQGGNMSGAFWNPLTQKLWVISNSGSFWRMGCASGQNCMQASSWSSEKKWTIGGDIEAITQASLSEAVVYIGVERDGNGHRLIRKCNVPDSSSSADCSRSWDLLEMYTPNANSGLESLTFVPDSWLTRRGFKTSGGSTYTGSAYGSGGLFFAGLQAGPANIFVYDINVNVSESYTFLGSFSIGQSELAELFFDRSAGILFSYTNRGSFSKPGTVPEFTITKVLPLLATMNGRVPLLALPS